MKICFITEYFDKSYGGQYFAVKNVMEICQILKINYSIIFKANKNFIDRKRLIKEIQSSDIVYIFGGWTVFYIKMSVLSHKLKKKIIVHPMGFYEPWSLSQKKIKKTIAWYLYQEFFLNKADLIHCASNNEMLNLKKLNSKLNTVILPFALDKKNIKKKINDNFRKKCIFFSRLHKKKGLDKLLQAWISVNDQSWQLDIVGFGEKEGYVNKYNTSKYKNIKFLKPINSKKSKINLLDKYDFLALPSANENFGIVILEALARGLPVLTTNQTPWKIIQDQKAGWIINDSLIELKLALHQIFFLSNNEFYKRKKKATQIAKKFTNEKIAKFYLKAFKNVLSL
jgi:glycosyltransferase involved in cell wall biosynthesis